MDNHIHIIWQAEEGYTSRDNQHSFTKYTAQKIKYDLMQNHHEVLLHFKVNAKDRMYQFWERNALSVIIYSEPVLIQKLNYIHENPVKAGLCKLPEEYEFSSASFYIHNDTKYDFLFHI